MLKPPEEMDLNAFDRRFLNLIDVLDEAPGCSQADYGGPWKIVPLSRELGVFRSWEDPRAGDLPTVVTGLRETALRFTAVLPCAGVEHSLYLADSPEAHGFAIRGAGPEALAWMQHFNPDLFEAYRVSEHLARSPVSVAAVLESAGPLAIHHVGRILARNMGAQVRRLHPRR